MFYVAAFLGVGQNIANTIVYWINVLGTAAVVFSVVSVLLSGGSLAILESSLDYVVLVVKGFLADNEWAQAAAW